MALLAADPVPRLAIRQLDVADVGVAPVRFQFKGNVNPETGATTKLAGGIKYDPLLGGVLYAWEDRAGKVWVVNGHHRLDLAKRSGYPTINAVVEREADGVTEADARSRGALINIAEGQGTPIDVAKFLRDSGQSVEWLRSRDIAPSNRLVERGAALAQLDDSLFRRVLTGTLSEDAGVVIGAGLPGDAANQRAVADLVSGTKKELTPRELKALIQEAKGQTVKVQQINLFGETVEEKSTMIARAKVRAWVEDELAHDKRLFSFVTKAGRPEQLARGETVVNIERGQELARQSGTALEIFNAKVNAVGPINDIVREAAEEVVKGGNERAARENSLRRVREAISTGVALGDGPRADRVGEEASATGIGAETPSTTESTPVEPVTFVGKPWYRGHAEGQPFGQTETFVASTSEQAKPFADQVGGMVSEVTFKREPRVYGAVIPWDEYQKYWRNSALLAGYDVVPIMEPNGQATSYAVRNPEIISIAAAAPTKIYRGRQIGTASTGAEWWTENKAFAQSFADELRGRKPGAGAATGEVVEDVLPIGDIRDIDMEVGSHARLSLLATKLGVSESDLRAAVGEDPLGDVLAQGDDPIRVHVILEMPSVQKMLRAKGIVAVKAQEISDRKGTTIATFLRLDHVPASEAKADAPAPVASDIRILDPDLTGAIYGQKDLVIVAKKGDAMVGYANLADVDDGQVHLQMVEVAEQFRRQGIGTRLVQAAEAYARGKGKSLEWTNTTPEGTALRESMKPKSEQSKPGVTAIPYRPDLDVRNVDQLARGTGARYLIALRGQGDEYVASRWARRLPGSLETGEVAIDFKAPTEPTPLKPATGPIVQAGFGGDMGPGQVARGDAERAPMVQAPLTEIAASEATRIAESRSQSSTVREPWQMTPAEVIRERMGLTQAAIDAYDPAKAIRKVGKRWSFVTFQGNDHPGIFDTRKEAVAFATSHKNLKQEQFDNPTGFFDLFRLEAGDAVKMFDVAKRQSANYSELDVAKSIPPHHAELVEAAVAAGKPVPEAVLAAYPNLQAAKAELAITGAVNPSFPDRYSVVTDDGVRELGQNKIVRVRSDSAQSAELQPWQMTRVEYLRFLGHDLSALRTDADGQPRHVAADADHAVAVADAIAEGKPVPDAVLAEYPETAKGDTVPAAFVNPATKEPWRMTRAEFQIAEYTPMVEGIRKAIREGKSIAVRTQYRIIPLRKPEYIWIDKLGDVRIPSGRKSVVLVEPQVFSLAAQAGMKPPTFDERIYHHAAVREAVAAGKPVPPEVLREYPDIAPATLETSKERGDRLFRETEAKFAEEAASTETISEREARRAKEKAAQATGVAASSEKQAWELTHSEWMQTRSPGTSPGMHAWYVREAMQRGESVPPEVLASLSTDPLIAPLIAQRLTELHSPQSIAASFAKAGQEVAERDAAMRTLAAKLPDGTVINGWTKGTVPDGPMFWEKGRRNTLDIHKEVGGRKLVKALGLPEDANNNPKNYVNVAATESRQRSPIVAAVVVGPRLSLSTREIDTVERSARLSDDIATKLASYKAAERDFRGSRRMIEPRRKVRLD